MADGGKTLTAQLPPMRTADLARFEAEGGVWGRQRAIRRKQLTVTGVTTAGISTVGLYWSTYMRGNTSLVAACTLPVYLLFGSAVGHAAGITLYPSVADNGETTMMRRLWWARECAKGWDMSQINGALWNAKYPNVALDKIQGKA